jgi:hypothetical protein
MKVVRPIRRVVTHNDENGLSYALLDGVASNVIGGLTEIWVTGPELPGDDSKVDIGLQSDSLEPPPQGSVFRFFQIPPESSLGHLTREERLMGWEDLFKKLNAPHAQPDTSRDPGMHKSRTTDYIILLSGSIHLVLDKGEVELQPFDAVVQRGTNHSWVNRGSTDALLMAVLVDDVGGCEAKSH